MSLKLCVKGRSIWKLLSCFIFNFKCRPCIKCGSSSKRGHCYTWRLENAQAPSDCVLMIRNEEDVVDVCGIF